MKRLSIQLYNAKKGESLTLPLNPETTDLPNERDIRTYNILGYGEVPVKGNRQLKRINLTNLLPEENTYFALLASLVRQMNYYSYSLDRANDMLNRWVDDQDIIRVIIAGYLNAEFILERYTASIKESVPDIGYSIDLVEYRNPEADTSTTINAPISNIQKLKNRINNRFIPSSIVAQAGQTAYKIASLNYGGRWQELMMRNGITNANFDLGGKIVEMLPL